MKNLSKIKFLVIALCIGIFSFNASAQGIGDILKGLGGASGKGDILNSIIDGVFSSSNITVQDIVGTYTSEGPAVTFKSDNLLQKAGGIAATATIESKLKPYYDKYGLNGMTVTIDADSKFTMKIKKLPISGTIEKNEGDGTFQFKISLLGNTSITTYIEKSGNTLKLMFDAKKLMDLISAVAKISGNSLASTAGSILSSYDGACVGFKLVKTGDAPGSTNNNSSTNSNSETTTNSSSSGSSPSDVVNGLMNILNKKK